MYHLERFINQFDRFNKNKNKDLVINWEHIFLSPYLEEWHELWRAFWLFSRSLSSCSSQSRPRETRSGPLYPRGPSCRPCARNASPCWAWWSLSPAHTHAFRYRGLTNINTQCKRMRTHSFHPVYIQSSGGDICGHQNINLFILETPETQRRLSFSSFLKANICVFNQTKLFTAPQTLQSLRLRQVSMKLADL